MKYLESSADISEDGLYRYWLSRRLAMGERTVLFVGLNPSKADATDDDPTIRRCVGFARSWGFDWLLMGNPNAWRSTDPKQLPRDPLTAVGPRNQEALKWMAQRSELVVAAWGKTKLNDYARTLSTYILERPGTRCLGCNNDGSPKHPLYLPAITALESIRLSRSSEQQQQEHDQQQHAEEPAVRRAAPVVQVSVVDAATASEEQHE